MNIEELFTTIRNEGLVPVPLASDPSTDNSSYWPFSGSMSEFLTVARSVGAKAVYVATEAFDDSFFEYDPTSEIEEIEGTTMEFPYDLISLDPRLSEFKKHIGQFYLVVVFISLPEIKLRLEVWSKWYEEFSEIYQPLVEGIWAESLDEREAQEAEQEELVARQRDELLSGLNGLPDRVEFNMLGSKSAMTAYVNENFPLCKEILDPREFMQKMTELYQQAQLKRSRRRR